MSKNFAKEKGMVKFEGYKLEMKLEAQMPMIHFQSEQCGATLRASEMKPKFDAFLLNKMCKKEKKSIKDLKKDDQYKGVFLDPSSNENNALDYKVQITVSDKWEKIELGEYEIFYGNKNKIKGILANITVTFICFKSKIRTLIEENIEDFFVTTNFGMMQNKGFGSFVLKNDVTDEKVAEAYKKLIPKSSCYVMNFTEEHFKQIKSVKSKYAKMSYVIKEFYSKLRTGEDSYIRKYRIDDNSWGNKNNSDYKYLRALLGNIKNMEITIKRNQEDVLIQRLSSPIFFKVIGNKVYIVAEVPKELQKRKFKIIKKTKDEKGKIDKQVIESKTVVPPFDIKIFLKSYVEKYNKDLRNKNYPKVNEIVTKEVNSNV